MILFPDFSARVSAMIPNTIAKKCSLVRGMGAAHRLAQCTPQNSTAHATAAYSTTKSSSSQESTLLARVKDFAANAAAETYSAAMLQALAPYGTSSSRSASSTNAPVRPRPSATSHSGLAMGRCSMARNMSSSPRSVLGATRGMKIATARPVNEGKQVDIEFADQSAYRFHTAWIKMLPRCLGIQLWTMLRRPLADLPGERNHFRIIAWSRLRLVFSIARWMSPSTQHRSSVHGTSWGTSRSRGSFHHLDVRPATAEEHAQQRHESLLAFFKAACPSASSEQDPEYQLAGLAPPVWRRSDEASGFVFIRVTIASLGWPGLLKAQDILAPGTRPCASTSAAGLSV